VSAAKTIEYGEKSGRPSELRAYEAGEGLTIEAQEDGYVLAWSAHIPADTFMEAVKTLVDASAEAELSPSPNGRHALPFAEALAIVGQQASEFSFITVATADESFSWEAADPGAKGPYPQAPGEVGIMFSALNRIAVERMIETTATPHVLEDISGILDSAQHLTRSTPASTPQL
jgi:hypothetical protein